MPKIALGFQVPQGATEISERALLDGYLVKYEGAKVIEEVCEGVTGTVAEITRLMLKEEWLRFEGIDEAHGGYLAMFVQRAHDDREIFWYRLTRAQVIE